MIWLIYFSHLQASIELLQEICNNFSSVPFIDIILIIFQVSSQASVSKIDFLALFFSSFYNYKYQVLTVTESVTFLNFLVSAGFAFSLS